MRTITRRVATGAATLALLTGGAVALTASPAQAATVETTFPRGTDR